MDYKETLEKAKQLLEAAGGNAHPSPLGNDDNAIMLRSTLLPAAMKCMSLHKIIACIAATAARCHEIDHLKALLRLMMAARLVMHEIARLVGAHPDVESKFWTFHGTEAIEKFLTDENSGNDILFDDFDKESLVPSVDDFTPEAFEKAQKSGGGDA